MKMEGRAVQQFLNEAEFRVRQLPDSELRAIVRAMLMMSHSGVLVTGLDNTANGYRALYGSTGSGNTADGYQALNDNTTGRYNIALGILAGYNLTTGNDNIDIGNVGVAGESGAIRIGSPTKQTSAYIAGVYGKPVTGSARPAPARPSRRTCRRR